jgi:hypothetical protein
VKRPSQRFQHAVQTALAATIAYAVALHVDVPPEVELRVGTTASVLVMTGTADAGAGPSVPRALQ